MAACACMACVLACVSDPGRLVPDDVAPIAQRIGVTPGVLFSDYLERDARGGWKPRKTPNGCVFLNGQRCYIHDVKPFVCREWMHDLTTEQVDHINRQAAEAWNGHNHDSRQAPEPGPQGLRPDRGGRHNGG